MSATETPLVTPEEVKAAIIQGVNIDLITFMPKFKADRTASDQARQSIANLPKDISPFVIKQLENSIKDLKEKEDKALSANISIFLVELHAELKTVFSDHGMRTRKARSASDAVQATEASEPAAVAGVTEAPAGFEEA